VPIPIQCSSCQSRYAAPDHLAGKSVRCPQCQSAVAIPAGPAAAGDQSAQDDKEPQKDNESHRDTAAQDTEAKSKDEPWRGKPSDSATPPSSGGGGWDDDEEEVDETDPDAVTISPDGERIETEMDMTPMVDVTFLLLIFFMVTASFSLQKSLEVPTPTESDQASTNARPEDKPPEEDPDYVIVHVDAFNTYQVTTPEWEEEAPSAQDLHILLRRAREGGAGGTVPTKLIVRANIESLHEKVVTAIDAGAAAGMEEVQLMTVEDD
jgi:biopolymer transport protein ExbD